mmetsp:Transcript_23131/g.54125  ORF Transcript_23131/g.54125 Transcript_23131/m.54125 type:complete len:168 (-) Transcript_23131:128-631(-)
MGRKARTRALVKKKNKQEIKQKRAAKAAAAKAKAAPGLCRKDFAAKGKRRRAALDALTLQAKEQVAALGPEAVETEQALRDRQAREWKEMKSKVQRLKKERNKLPKRGCKESRANVGQEIRILMGEMTTRHEAEKKALGIDQPEPSKSEEEEEEDEGRGNKDSLMKD